MNNVTTPAFSMDFPSIQRGSRRAFVWRRLRGRRRTSRHTIRTSAFLIIAYGLFIGVCAAQQLPPAPGPVPELRRGPNGQLEVVPPHPEAPHAAPKARAQPVQPKAETARPPAETVQSPAAAAPAPPQLQPQPAPAAHAQPQPAPAPPAQSQPAVVPPAVPATDHATAQPPPAAAPAAPAIKLPEPLAIELPAGVSGLSPLERPLRDLLLRANSNDRRITYDLSHPVGVGPVEVTWTAWDRATAGDRAAATKTATLFVLPSGMTPAGESGSENATAANNATKIARDAAGRVHVVWKTNAKVGVAHVLYRRGSTDGDSFIWETDPVPVEEATEVGYDSYPGLAVSGEVVHVAWQAGGTVHYRRVARRSGGWQWGPERDLGAASRGRDVGPAIDAIGSTIHIATPTGYYAKSTDGGDTWAVEPFPLPPDMTIKTQSIAADRSGNAHIAFSAIVGKVPPGAGGYWELRYVRRTADGLWVDAQNVLAGLPEWAAGPGDHLADWARVLVDDDNNIHLTWHGTAISREYAHDQSYYSVRRATGPGSWDERWQPPVRLMPSDPADRIGFSYAPALAVDDEVAVPVTFYDVGGQGFDAAARIVRQGNVEGSPIRVADWMRMSIDTSNPQAALSARFPTAAPRLFHTPDGRIWLDILETLNPIHDDGAPKLIVYHPIDVTDAVQGRWTPRAIWRRLSSAATAIGGGFSDIANRLLGRRAYSHIFVIIEENHGFQQIIGNPAAPNINRLAADYGLATNFYAEAHTSEPNYVAIIGGDTFGIYDDDGFYCKPGSADRHCSHASRNNYADHTITGRSLIDQLNEQGLTWKGYFEDIPAPGSKAVYSSGSAASSQPDQLYAAKHNGFINFAVVQNDPQLASKIVGFDQLEADLASGKVPNYAHIVPNQCNEMHGLDGRAPNVPSDCRYDNDQGLIARGDKTIGDLVGRIQASPAWSARGNFAIVVTWDENEGPHSTKQAGAVEGCCGSDPASIANNGGGHIATIVITNHGPRRVTDDTPYNHYSLLRTTEDAFGIAQHSNYAGSTERGVRSMKPLFGIP